MHVNRYFAHSTHSSDQSDWQRLSEHLVGTSLRAGEFLERVAAAADDPGTSLRAGEFTRLVGGEGIERSSLRERLSGTGLRPLTDDWRSEITPPESINLPPLWTHPNRRGFQLLWARMLFWWLVDTDHRDTEGFVVIIRRGRSSEGLGKERGSKEIAGNWLMAIAFGTGQLLPAIGKEVHVLLTTVPSARQV